MAEWKQCTISDLGTVVGGATPSTKDATNYENGTVSWITPKDLSDFKGRYIQRGERNITEKGLRSCSAQIMPADTVLFSSRAPIGYIAIAKNDLCTNQGFKSVIPNKSTDPLFLYYLLKYNKDAIEHMGSGTTFKEVSGNTMKNIVVRVPVEIQEQRRIAQILGSLDDKIEENDRINNNLYHLLSLSFKNDYWDRAIDHPEWIMTTLDETTSRFGTGLNPRKNFVLGHGNNYYVTIKNMGNNRIYLDDRCDKIDDEAIRRIQMRSDLKVGDLLFSGIGTIGRVFLIDKPATNWNTSESVFNLRPNAKVSSEFLYLLLLNNDMQDYAISLASGSVQKGIRMADLKKYSFYLPTQEAMERLTSLWKPLIKQIKANEVESDGLAVLRDTILPKLLSGEIDVSEVEF